MSRRDHQLRGVMIEAQAEIHRDTGRVTEIGIALAARYGGTALGAEARADTARAGGQARRTSVVALRTASWNHRKLAGAY